MHRIYVTAILAIILAAPAAAQWSAQFRPHCSPTSPHSRECTAVSVVGEPGENFATISVIKMGLAIPPNYTTQMSGGVVLVYDDLGNEVLDPDGGGLRLHCAGKWPKGSGLSPLWWHIDVPYPSTKTGSEIRWHLGLPPLCHNLGCSVSRIWCGIKDTVIPPQDIVDSSINDSVWYEPRTSCIPPQRPATGTEVRLDATLRQRLDEQYGNRLEIESELVGLNYVIRYD